MQPVSATFLAAELADIAKVAYAVYILRGNYATAAFGSTATSTGDDASGNYPASGAIDGDRTEINIGAPSAADNGVGLSSWKSSTIPDTPTTTYLEIDFNATRTINLIKLYHRDGHSSVAYNLQYWTGAAWSQFYSQADVGARTLDEISFTAITMTKIRLYVTDTEITNDPAEVVELEAYYKQDISDRVSSIKPSRGRDWKQVTPMAATCEIVLNNNDSFFSVDYTPTAAQIADGFFNSELDEDLGLIIQIGFDYNGSPLANPELVNSFIGSIDSISENSRTGVAIITGRDGMKAAINTTRATKLQQNIDNGAAIQYMLNLANVSNYEMSIATTSISQPYFFVFDQSVFTTIQQLVQASGRYQFWFDENGIATFAANEANSSHTDFIFPLVNLTTFATIQNGGSITNANGAIILYASSASTTATTLYYNSTTMTAWQWTSETTTVGPFQGSGVVFATQSYVLSGGFTYVTGYGLNFNVKHSVGGTVSLCRYDNTGVERDPTLTGSEMGFINTGNAFTKTTWTVIMANNGGSQVFYVFMNGVRVITAADSTYTTTNYIIPYAASAAAAASSTHSVSNLAVLNPTFSITTSGPNIVFTSSPIEQTNIDTEGNIQAGFAPSNAPLTFQTATAATAGGTYTAFATATLDSETQSGPIPSPTDNFIKYQFYFDDTPNINWPVYYVIVGWNPTGAAGTIRQLSYDSSVCDIEKTLSGSLSGDSSIINYVEVQAAPLLLTGSNSDTQWQGTFGFPAANVSASNPFLVNTGTIVIQAIVSSGMDIALMSGASPAALAITFGTATGSTVISYIHPTRPIITITVTGVGTITDLRLVGMAFSNLTIPIDVVSGDTASQQRYNSRQIQIKNNWITIPAIAQLVGNTQLTLYKNPAKVLTGISIMLCPSIQNTDQIQLTDIQTGLTMALTWNVSEIVHDITKDASSADGATIRTSLKAVLLLS